MSGIPVADDVLDTAVAVLPLAEVAKALGTSANKVRQMLREGQLIAVKRGGELCVPEAFFVKDGVVKGLAGTITVLADSGFSRTEMLRWLFAEDDTLPGTTPVNALRTSHGTEVKRRAQAMAF
ncbi:Rv2175c family DNA-binding protein [Amycolatopsis sp. PS_44_ISF1]|uniref:Rv2175c family DNA-binding protein n=1 Tax=Amycolatopsis sp. PS_44_ISF1 TaxID=2974917 RepID=UPI0028DFF46A|nr:Rv2175c family DNA-binding protein [Amycolatopsis sp. PS_44_ISF1]MDT8914309.1 Rv2175c family DNA-binding protein [Amycolatopsis sp. PS_44_ISF1]